MSMVKKSQVTLLLYNNYYYILLLLLPVLLLLSFVPNNIPTKRSWLSTQACLHRALGQPPTAERSFTAPRQRPAGFPRALAAAAEVGGSLVRPGGEGTGWVDVLGKVPGKPWTLLIFSKHILFGDMKSLPIVFVFVFKLCSPKKSSISGESTGEMSSFYSTPPWADPRKTWWNSEGAVFQADFQWPKVQKLGVRELEVSYGDGSRPIITIQKINIH